MLGSHFRLLGFVFVGLSELQKLFSWFSFSMYLSILTSSFFSPALCAIFCKNLALPHSCAFFSTSRLNFRIVSLIWLPDALAMTAPPRRSELVSDWLKFTRAWVKTLRRLLFHISIMVWGGVKSVWGWELTGNVQSLKYFYGHSTATRSRC